MRTQRVLKVTKSRSMVNIKQYMYSQYRHTLTKIDARASKNLPTTIVSQSLARAAVSSGTLAHYWYIATLAHRDIATRAHWDSGTIYPVCI